jgi:hypothetical protein
MSIVCTPRVNGMIGGHYLNSPNGSGWIIQLLLHYSNFFRWGIVLFLGTLFIREPREPPSRDGMVELHDSSSVTRFRGLYDDTT